MKVLIDIPDNKADFALEVLHSLSFVKKTVAFSKSKSEFYENIKLAAEDVKMHKAGKIKLKTAHQLLNEL